MVDLPCELKGLRGVHAWNELAKERNDLVIGMALAIEHEHPCVEISACVGAGGLCGDGRREGSACAGHGGEF